MPPDSLTAAIEAVHQAMVDHSDPQDVADLSGCLRVLTKIQQRAMSGPGGQAGGPQGGGPPPGSPQQALLAQLQG